MFISCRCVIDISPQSGDVLWLRSDILGHMTMKPQGLECDARRYGSALFLKRKTLAASVKRTAHAIEVLEGEKKKGTYNEYRLPPPPKPIVPKRTRTKTLTLDRVA